jgi:hypothetical protein
VNLANELAALRSGDFLNRVITNPPGRSALDYRLATWPEFLAAMASRLRTASFAGGAADGQLSPLDRLSGSPHDNWVFALLQSWAMAGDVLTFYTERIANEGFLRTAQEERSVRELVRLLDEAPQPGIASATAVSFTVAALKGMVKGLSLPSRTRLQNVPAQGQLPQTFETVETTDLRAEWNALVPRVAVSPVEQVLLGSSREILLQGTATGLKSGDSLLLTARARGDEGPESRSYLRLVLKADAPRLPRPSPANTRVSWQGELEPAQPTLRLTGPQAFVLRRQAALFGYNAPPWKDQPEEVKRQYSPPQGGVLLGSSDWASWRPINGGLPAPAPNALAAVPGACFAAVQGKGVFRASGESWQPTGRTLARKEVLTLLADEREQLFAGTSDGGVYRSLDRGDTWEALAGSLVARKGKTWRRIDTRLPRSPVRCLAAVADGSGGVILFAGTDQGLFQSIGEVGGWRPASAGLPGLNPATGFADVSVRAVVAAGEPGGLLAGTTQGVFRSSDNGGSWVAASQGLPDTDPKTGASATAVQALAVLNDARTRTCSLFAGTAKGVFLSTDLGGSWRPVSRGLPGTDPRTGLSATAVTCLAAASDPRTLASYLFAGTPAGLFLSGDLGGSWGPASGVPAAPVSALALPPEGGLLVSTPLQPVGGDEWPGFFLQDGEVDLAAVYPKVAPGSWLVLYQPREQEGALQGVYPIREVAVVRRQGFTLEGNVTRLRVDPGQDLAAFDLRTTAAYVQSEPLALFVGETVDLAPLGPDRIELAHPLASRFGGPRALFVAGKSLRAVFPGPVALTPDVPGAPEETLAAGEEVQVLARKTAPDGRLTLRVRRSDGTAGSVTVAAEEIAWRSAVDGDAITAELTEGEDTIVPAEAGAREATSVLALSAPLRGCFDPQTARISANVAPATQGGTVARDVLGSGDSSPNQRFALTQPLTYLPAANPSGMASTLEVRVHGMLCQEVPRLYDAGPRDPVYMVRTDGQGRTMVIFGDGVHGARVPPGRENVEASYRSGMWTDRVSAGRLTILQTRPLGLRAATNPLAIAPATPPEAASEVRDRVPKTVRTLGRIVSLSDYADFARTFPGIAKACVKPLWAGSSRLLEITVAAADGRDLAPEDSLYQALLSALEEASGTNAPLRLDSFRRMPFDVEAVLSVDPRYRLPEVEGAVSAALAEGFGFAASRFGQTLTPAEVVAAIERVPGVLAAHLEVFRESGDPETVVRRQLQATEASYAPETGVQPAGLLLLNPGGPRLSTEGSR